MSRAIVVHEIGGPEVLKLEERTVGLPGQGQLKIRHEAIGLNFIDVYHRIGLYKMDLPFVPGVEGAGIVEAVGDGADEFSVGDRVGYAGLTGSYADERLIAADKVVPIPAGVGSDIAAAVISKAGTAHYLLFETWPLKAADTILVHAASGGVGSFLVQWASAVGATVIALAGSDEKAAGDRQRGQTCLQLARGRLGGEGSGCHRRPRGRRCL